MTAAQRRVGISAIDSAGLFFKNSAAALPRSSGAVLPKQRRRLTHLIPFPMSEPLTAERFDQFVEAYSQNHGAIIKRLDTIDTTLADHTKRLERIESSLWSGQRLDEHERRIIKLAELVGAADLAAPISRPIGS